MSYVSDARTDLANEQRDRKADQVTAEKAARVAVEEARTEERRRITEQQEIIDGQTKALARARADAAAAAGSVDKLRKRASELAAQCDRAAADPAPAEGSAPANAAGDLLADMLGRIDGAARTIAEFADEARIAGIACERSYDALSPRK